MITIHPQYLTLSKLLDGRLFRIPEYQRAYSWTSSERQDLFGDIEKIRAKGQEPRRAQADPSAKTRRDRNSNTAI